MNEKILIIEDEPAIQDLLRNYLEDAGYYINTAGDGLTGFTMFESGEYSLILLDIMLPKIDGYVLMEMIRRKSDIPVILISAMGEEDNQIKGFDLKADDYITKPFSIPLVLRRIEVALRRGRCASSSSKGNNTDRSILTCKDLVMDRDSCEVCLGEKSIALTYKEYELLKLFMEYPNIVFSREQIIDRIWGPDYYGDNKVVNVHVNNLRNKIAGDFIKTVRGMGYKLDT